MLRDSRPRPPKPLRQMPRDPKPVLDMHRLPIFRVHHTKLEAYIQTVFGFDFDFCSVMLIQIGECVDFTLDGKLPTNELVRRAADLRTGQRTRDVKLILMVLAHDGYIPLGKYTVVTHPLPDPVDEYRKLLQFHGDPRLAPCVAFRAANKHTPGFQAKAAVLDKVMLEAKRP